MPRPPPAFHNNFKRAKKKYVYIPAPTSGAYAILLSMLKAEKDDLIKRMDKQQILSYCSKYSQFGSKDGNKIWACMRGLIDKSLVGRVISRDPTYFLEEEGRDLAEKLIQLSEGKPLDDESSQDTDINANSNGAFVSELSNPYEPEVIMSDNGLTTFELKAGTYEIILVVDNRERITIISPDQSVKTEYINLACGDFLWIARPKNMSLNDRTKDLVLDYVVERKRLDDLQSSIMDGRYEQQKYRLLDCGLRRPTYLIEEFGQLRHTMTHSALSQAVTSMFVKDGINVERTKSPTHSCDYLLKMTKCLQQFYQDKSIRSCTQEKLKQKQATNEEHMTFSEFQVVGAKITNWTVREMFAKHLIQMTGMSDKRVAVIINQYPTIKALMAAYGECSSEKEKENLLSKMSIPDSNRTIGPKLSQRVYTTYGMPCAV